MFYFRKNGEVIEKYRVHFDKDEIAKLKKEMQNYRDAKKNVDQILQVEKGEKREKENGRDER